MELLKMVERNDSCPCGSGKKYKKCCERVVSIEAFQQAKEQRYTEQMIKVLIEVQDFAKRNGSYDEFRRLQEKFAQAISVSPNSLEAQEFGLFNLWYLFDYTHQNGMTWAVQFREQMAVRLDREQMQILNDLIDSAIFIYQYVGKDRNIDRVEDIFTGEQLEVHGLKSSGNRLLPWQLIATRIIPFQDQWLSVFTYLPQSPYCKRDLPLWLQKLVEDERIWKSDISLSEIWKRNAVDLLDGYVHWEKIQQANQASLWENVQLEYSIQGSYHEVNKKINQDPKFIFEREEGRTSHYFFLESDTQFTTDKYPGVLLNIVKDRGQLSVTPKTVRFNGSRSDVNSSIKELEALLGDMAVFKQEKVDYIAFPPHMRPESMRICLSHKLPQNAVEEWVGEILHKSWLDQSIPVLDNKTPKEAAQKGGYDEPLEGMLREQEFTEVYRAVMEGKPAYSTAWLREQLGLPLSGLDHVTRKLLTEAEELTGVKSLEMVHTDNRGSFSRKGEYMDLWDDGDGDGETWDDVENVPLLSDYIDTFLQEEMARMSDSSRKKYEEALFTFEGYYSRKFGTSFTWDDIHEESLTDFLGYWYVAEYPSSKTGATNLLSALNKWFRWLDIYNDYQLYPMYKSEVLPHFKNDLPYAFYLSNLFYEWGFENHVRSISDKLFTDEKPLKVTNEGLYQIIEVRRSNDMVVKSIASDGKKYTIPLTAAIAKEVREGFILDMEIGKRKGKWEIIDIGDVYPPIMKNTLTMIEGGHSFA
jgi:hypothetical protein